MSGFDVHGSDPRESERLHDQAVTPADLLHDDTWYRAGSPVLEAAPHLLTAPDDAFRSTLFRTIADATGPANVR